MPLNKKKSGVLRFQKKREKYADKEEYLGFPIVKSYKYLGIWIDENLNFQEHIKHIEKKIKKSMKMLNTLHWKKTDI